MDAATKRRQPFVPVVVTAPFGDTHSFVGKQCTSSLQRFVVPEAFLHQKPPLFTVSGRNPPSTSYLMGFPKPSEADTAKNRQQAAWQAEQAAAMKVGQADVYLDSRGAFVQCCTTWCVPMRAESVNYSPWTWWDPAST